MYYYIFIIEILNVNMCKVLIYFISNSHNSVIQLDCNNY